MSNLNMINNDNMISASSSNNITPIPQQQQSSMQDSKDNRIMELRVAEQSLDFSNRNFSREVYIYHKKQERFKKTVMGVHTIVSKKLYRLSDLTLEEYFRSRWKISRAQVYRFLDAAEVLKQLNEFTFLPSHELLCRTLKQHAKCPEHMKILWESVLSKVGDHLTSINSSLISSTWMELIKDGKVVPLPPQPKKAKKRSRKSGSLSEGETDDLSSVKVIKTKHPNLSNDENKLAYNLLEYNEKQINSNIKTNNIGKRASNYKISGDMNANEYGMNRDYYGERERDINPHYGPPISDYGRSPNMRPLDYSGMPPRNPVHPYNPNSSSYNSGNYSNYDLKSPESYSKNRNEIPMSNNKSQFYSIDTMKTNNNNSNERYYNEGNYRPEDKGRGDMYKYRNDDREPFGNMNRNKPPPNAPYYLDDNRNASQSLVKMPNDRPPNYIPDNRRYSDYELNPPDPRNRNNDPNRIPYPPDSLPNKKSPPYYDGSRPPPNDRYYDDYYSERNNRYRSESIDKLNYEGYNPPENIGMNRPISPVSMNTPPSSRKPDAYDTNNSDNNSKRLKQPYYYSNSSSPNQSRNVNQMTYGEPPIKTHIKYISSPMASDINPRISNMNINDNRNNSSNHPSTIRNPTVSNVNFDNSPSYRNPDKSYPPDDRYYKDNEPRNARVSDKASGNSRNNQPPPPIDNMKDGYSDPSRTSRNYNQDQKYPPSNENGPSKFIPPHQFASPHNSHDMVNHPSNRTFSNDPSKRTNYSSSASNGGSQTDPNRFSLYNIVDQPNSSRDSPSLPPISSLKNNEPYKNPPSPYSNVNKTGSRNDSQSFNYQQDSRRPYNDNSNINYDDYNYKRNNRPPPPNKENPRDTNTYLNPDGSLNRNEVPPYYPEKGASYNIKNGPNESRVGSTPGPANRMEGYSEERFNSSNGHPPPPNIGNDLSHGPVPPERGNSKTYNNDNPPDRNNGDINSANGRYYHSFK